MLETFQIKVKKKKAGELNYILVVPILMPVSENPLTKAKMLELVLVDVQNYAPISSHIIYLLEKQDPAALSSRISNSKSNWYP